MKRLLISVVCAAIVSLMPSVAISQDTEFKIGGVVTLTGPYGVLGTSMKRGAELAADMRGNRVLDVPIHFNWEDDESKPQIAVQKGARLISSGAHILFAPVSSGSTVALMKVADRAKIPLLVTISLTDDIIGKDKNAYTFRTSNSADMEHRMVSEFAKNAGISKVFNITSDYTIGRDGAVALKTKLAQHGIDVIGEEFPAFGTKDFSVLINKALNSGADAMFMGLAGNEVITFLKQANQFSLKDKMKLFGLIVMDESIARAVGDEGSLGVNSVLRYHFSTDNPANKVFVKAYRDKYGEFPDQYAGEAYDGMSWFLDVINSTKSWDKTTWLKSFETSRRPNSVEGSKVMRACDHQAEQPGYYGHAVRGTGDLPPVTMEVTHIFTADQLFNPCP